MRKPKSQRASLLFVALLAFVVMIFSGFGMTYAYFQGSKISEGEFKIGSLGAKWYNVGTVLTNTNIYQLAGTTELERGDTNGANITKTDGTEGGDLRLVANSDSTGQYVRIKPQAIVGKNLIEIVDFVDNVDNAYYNDLITDFVLEAGKTYTLSFNYSWTGNASSLSCSIGCGVSTFAIDVASKSYTNSSGRLVFNFTPTADQLASGTKLAIRFTRANALHTTINNISKVKGICPKLYK